MYQTVLCDRARVKDAASGYGLQLSGLFGRCGGIARSVSDRSTQIAFGGTRILAVNRFHEGAIAEV